jgi:hypothetical protein
MRAVPVNQSEEVADRRRVLWCGAADLEILRRDLWGRYFPWGRSVSALEVHHLVSLPLEAGMSLENFKAAKFFWDHAPARG